MQGDSVAGAVPRKVLVIDDNAEAADMLAQLLVALGADAASAHSARSACAHLAESVADIIFLDIGMPDMDGYELAELFRNEMHIPSHIIALTGYSSDEVREKALRSGCTEVLVKPVGLPDLRRALSEYLPV